MRSTTTNTLSQSREGKSRLTILEFFVKVVNVASKNWVSHVLVAIAVTGCGPSLGYGSAAAAAAAAACICNLLFFREFSQVLIGI